MRFARIKNMGKGDFRQKWLPRCKCKTPNGKGDMVCRTCGLAVLTFLEKEAYRRAYPTTASILDDEGVP